MLQTEIIIFVCYILKKYCGQNIDHKLKRELLQKISKWKKYKPIQGKIEDFFKLCKSRLGLKKIHKYTVDE